MPCIYTLLLGATLGILVGILNLSAASNRWELQRDFFDIVDAPIRSLIPPPAFYNTWNGLRVVSYNTNFYGLHTVLVMICYWATIGLFLASLVCLVQAGVIRDIAREKVCRYILFIGIFAGAFTGSLGFLAALNSWEVPGSFFNFLNRPVNMMMNALQQRYNIPAFNPWGSQPEFIWWHSAAVVYWAVIGLLVASIFCVVRILMKRKAGGRVGVSGESL